MKKITNLMTKIGIYPNDYLMVDRELYSVSRDGYLYADGTLDIETTARVLFGMVDFVVVGVCNLLENDYMTLKMLSQLGYKSVMFCEQLYASKKNVSEFEKLLKDGGFLEKTPKLFCKNADTVVVPTINENVSNLKEELFANTVYPIKFLLKRYRNRVQK